jgi:hypothetical protein
MSLLLSTITFNQNNYTLYCCGCGNHHAQSKLFVVVVATIRPHQKLCLVVMATITPHQKLCPVVMATITPHQNY